MTHQMGTFYASLALFAENSPITGEFPIHRSVTQSFDVFFDLRLNERLSKQSWGWWFETPWRSLWCHCDGINVIGLIDVRDRPQHLETEWIHKWKQWIIVPQWSVSLIYMLITSTYFNCRLEFMSFCSACENKSLIHSSNWVRTKKLQSTYKLHGINHKYIV